MKIILKIIPLLLVAILLFTGCSTTDTYESLYDEYCQKITDTSPIILQEFMDEGNDEATNMINILSSFEEN